MKALYNEVVTSNRCSKCAAENPDGLKFCGNCGAKFVAIAPPVMADEADGVYFCHKHKKETTRVTCGRCERPICPKCMVMGHAGVRCRQCARNKVPVRLRGVMHNSGKAVGQINCRHVWYIAIWLMVLNFFRGMFGGGGHDV